MHFLNGEVAEWLNFYDQGPAWKACIRQRIRGSGSSESERTPKCYYFGARRAKVSLLTESIPFSDKTRLQYGEVAEWLKAPAWKACIRQRIRGSNPLLSSSFIIIIAFEAIIIIKLMIWLG